MSSRIRRKDLSFLAVLLLILFQVACNAQADKPGRGKGKGKDKDSTEVQMVPVETEGIELAAMASMLHVNGVLSTEAAVQVFPLVAGHVARILVEEGDRVSAGDTLLVLEDAELLLAERRFRLERDKARADYERLKDLVSMINDSLVARSDVENAHYAAQQARLNWESASLQVERSRLLAQIPGVVSERDVQLGDYLSGGRPVFTLVDDREYIAVLDVPEKEMGRLHKGQDVRARVEAAGGRDIKGWIKRISPVVDPESGTLRVTVGLSDDKGSLRSGMYARFNIVTQVKQGAIVLPKRSLIYDRDQVFVWIAGDSLAERRKITRGLEDETRVEALDGVEVGERLITVGQSGLKSNSPIRVIREDGIELAQIEPATVETEADDD